jgi:predicted nucleic acid-binding protein
MIVADTGPINHLIQINQVDVLPALFGQVFIPYEVQQELQHQRTPVIVRDWIAHPPSWLTMPGPGPRIVVQVGLHPGELAAMALAERLGNQTLLIDDSRGKEEATRRGLPVIGTVGVLYQAATTGMIDFERQLDALVKTNFYLSRQFRLRFLEMWKASKRT